MKIEGGHQLLAELNNNQSEMSIILCQPIRNQYYFVSTNQKSLMNCVNQSEMSIYLDTTNRVAQSVERWRPESNAHHIRNNQQNSSTHLTRLVSTNQKQCIFSTNQKMYILWCSCFLNSWYGLNKLIRTCFNQSESSIILCRPIRMQRLFLLLTWLVIPLWMQTLRCSCTCHKNTSDWARLSHQNSPAPCLLQHKIISQLEISKLFSACCWTNSTISEGCSHHSQGLSVHLCLNINFNYFRK